MAYKYNPISGELDFYESGGSGDIVGPVSSTDNAVARFDGVTGKLLENSVMIVDDNGNTSVNGSSGALSFNLNNTALSQTTKYQATVTGTAIGGMELIRGANTWYMYHDASAQQTLGLAALGDFITNNGGAVATQLNKGVRYNSGSVVTTSRNVANTDSGIIQVDTTGGAVTLTLTGTGYGSYRTFVIKDVGGAASTANIVIDTSAGTIDGGASVTINEDYGTVTIFYDGTDYFTSVKIPAAAIDPYAIVDGFDDFITSVGNTAALGKLNWRVVSGGGVTSQGVGTADHPGVVSLSVTATGGQMLQLGSQAILLGGGEWILEWIMQIPILSDATDTYSLRLGFGDPANATTAPTDGAWISYTHSVNSGAWVMNTSSNSVTTTANSATTVDTSWHKYKIVVNAAASSVAFYIDDVQMTNSPITTNIPTGTGRETGIMLTLQKTAGSTARTMEIDTFYFKNTLTNSR